MPKRIQMTRAKGGWRKENPGAVVVARPGKWGNPYRIGDVGVPDATAAVERFEANIASHFGNVDQIRGVLRGKDLACWCPLDQPCHADVLLRLANTPPRAPATDGGE